MKASRFAAFVLLFIVVVVHCADRRTVHALGVTKVEDIDISGTANLSAGTINTVLKLDSSKNVVPSSITADGTTTSIGTHVSVTDASGATLLNAAATPSAPQIEAKANNAGALGLLSYATNDQEIHFDVEWNGTQVIARASAAAAIVQNSTQLLFRGATGLTVGSPATLSNLIIVSLTSGNTTVAGTIQTGGTSGPSWLHGSGAPTGSCITGSFYSRTDGTSGATFYVCESSAWAAK